MDCNFYSATFLSKVGGNLKLNLIVISGIITFPALFTGFNPVIPVTVNWGLHVLFRIRSRLFLDTYSTPYNKAKSLTFPFALVTI